MKRQGIAVSLETVKWLEKTIKQELRDLKKLEVMKCVPDEKIGVQFNIINRPTKSGKRKMYCSDTWEFEK